MKDSAVLFNEFNLVSEFGTSKSSGVYGVFITTKTNTRCIYIGSSQNINKRVMNENHIYRLCYDRFSNIGTLVYVREILCDDYFNAEKKLIRKYKPLLNKIRYGS